MKLSIRAPILLICLLTLFLGSCTKLRSKSDENSATVDSGNTNVTTRDTADSAKRIDSETIDDAKINTDTNIEDIQCNSEELLCDTICVPNDEKNCGECGHDCTELAHVSGPIDCEDGKCVLTSSSCESGWADCNEDSEDGCETNTKEAINCGGCGNDCSETAKLLCAPAENDDYECAAECPSDAPTRCGDSCVNTEDNPLHCGECDKECESFSNSRPVCEDAKCGFECNDDSHIECPDGCFPNDDENCGTCGNDCTKTDEVCDGDGNCVECIDATKNCEVPENECMYAACDGDSKCSELPKPTGTICSIGTCEAGNCICNTHEDCGLGKVCDSGSCQLARCGDGILSADEECDPEENLYSAFTCSSLCKPITKYTLCNNNNDCVSGTICGNLKICTRSCTYISDCDTVNGFPNLDVQCPSPLGNQCVIRCVDGGDEDCPPNTVCNGAKTCVSPVLE